MVRGVGSVVLVCCAGALAAPAMGQTRASRGAGLVVDARVRIVVGAEEPQAVRTAANDLASDCAKVFGVKPRVEDEASGTSGTAIVIGEAGKLPENERPTGVRDPESFSIAARGDDLVLAGADMRGTIYAIYEFSQEFLGVDPLYYWTDHAPERRARVVVPANLDRVFPAPVFRYRGFFINDEDLLTGWAPGAKDHTGIALAVWDKVFETVLRLKGNMIVPGTWIFPDDPQVKAAGERGLIVTEHHAIPLGLNVARWPNSVPYNYTEHPEILERAWKDAVAEYPKGQEILWDVGLRGLSDVSYASMDASVRDNDKALGALISKAIQDQMAIVRATHPRAHFVTDLWQEGARLEQRGYLQIPPEVTTVWADDGSGYIQDKGEVKAGEGTYDHIAMLNGRANQLSEMVPVARTDEEMQRYIDAGATAYVLVNTSDIRPVTMSARAIMDLAWQGHLLGSDKGNAPPADAANDFYGAWAAEEFGTKAAPALAEMYKAYFAAPAQYGTPAHEYGDQWYEDETRMLLLTAMIDSPVYAIPSQSPKWEMARMVGEGYGRPNYGGKAWMLKTAAHEVEQCGPAEERWDAVWAKAQAAAALVAPERRDFYQGSVLTMVEINRESNRMLLEVSKAILDVQKGDSAAAKKDAAEAVAAVEAIRKAQAAAEYGKWKNWYRGDWLDGVYRTQEVVEAYAAFLKDPLTHLAPPILWNGWEGYYHILHYEGDREADTN